ncbi:hypothetical protein KQX54_001638 [Cotesia glomerata]|uniref:Uncharacterized protein n=1 Tax=Cotesia glomerata TaxID=32391 RepID=A0AAV7IP43_COTGL|nr:hypothetical protein KQX54_001638 [Cotesia glomerata]
MVKGRPEGEGRDALRRFERFLLRPLSGLAALRDLQLKSSPICTLRAQMNWECVEEHQRSRVLAGSLADECIPRVGTAAWQ